MKNLNLKSIAVTFALLFVMVLGMSASAKADDGVCEFSNSRTELGGYVRSFSHYFGEYQLDAQGEDYINPRVFNPYEYFFLDLGTYTAPVHDFYVVARRTSTGSIQRSDGSFMIQKSAGTGEAQWTITDLLPCTDYTIEVWTSQPITGMPESVQIFTSTGTPTINTSGRNADYIYVRPTFPNQ